MADKYATLRKFSSQFPPEVSALLSERDALHAALAELVRLQDTQYPGPPPHEWVTAWERASALIGQE
jgi:hypothetical protein